MRALYVTPMKSPDDPVPSGDRTIARATEKVLQHTGFDVIRANHGVTFLASPDADRMTTLQDRARHEIARLTQSADRPDLVFTYHNYYKAPDLIGPAIAHHFNVPYVISEASHAGKRARDAWAPWHARAEQALRAATLVLVAGHHDRDGLAQCVDAKRLAAWPPFIDDTLWPFMPRWAHRGRTRLLTVAMMREGDKFESYRRLAEALALSTRDDWHLTLVGDGPARDAVLALFAPFGARISWRGALQGMALADAYGDADLLVWPAVNEALGMVFLEAALQACPALACNEGGVAECVQDGITGRLVPARDVRAFASALDSLTGDPERLNALGAGAYAAAENASLNAAARRLQALLAPLGVRP